MILDLIGIITMKYKLKAEARKYFTKDHEGDKRTLRQWQAHGITEAALEPVSERVEVDDLEDTTRLVHYLASSPHTPLQWNEEGKKLLIMAALNGDMFTREEVVGIFHDFHGSEEGEDFYNIWIKEIVVDKD